MRQPGVSRLEGDRKGNFCNANNFTELLDIVFLYTLYIGAEFCSIYLSESEKETFISNFLGLEWKRKKKRHKEAKDEEK